MKNKLAIFDLDGTLFDTKDVNYYAYQAAIEKIGLNIRISYEDFCNLYNGKSYKEFLPKIIPNITEKEIQIIHDYKKKLYVNYLGKAKKNKLLFSIILEIKEQFFIALVTNASKKNTNDILDEFLVKDLFDLIVTQEDIKKVKPSTEGFIKAINYFNVSKKNTIIFEDSEIGIQAAVNSGIDFIRIYGYN